MFDIVNLNKSYVSKNGVMSNVLNNISLKLPQKGLVFILGKSGSGKTTLLNLLGGIDNFDSGDIFINGNSTQNFTQTDFDNYRNGMIGFVFQDFNLIEDMTVLQNVSLSLELQGKKPDRHLVAELLRKVDLSGFENRRINELSGGQKQRIAISRSIIKNSEVVLCDEPTGNLDSETSKNVLTFLKQISANKLVIIVTHDTESAFLYGDRVIEFKDGKILADLSRDIDLEQKHKKSTTINITKGQVITEEVLQQIQEGFKKDFKKYFVSTKSNNQIFEFKPLLAIKSHLSTKLAFKIGTSAFKTKKVSLFFNVLFASGLYWLLFPCFLVSALFVYSVTKVLTSPSYQEIIKIFNRNGSAYKIFFGFWFFIFIISFFLIGGFIKKSIQLKKKDIGVLRSLGSRKIDILKIFFSEGFVISCLIMMVMWLPLLFIDINIVKKTIKQEILTSTEPSEISEIIIKEKDRTSKEKDRTSKLPDLQLLLFSNLFKNRLDQITNQSTDNDKKQLAFKQAKEDYRNIRQKFNFYSADYLLLPIQFVLISLTISLSIYLPIYNFAKKKPIEMILDK